MKKYLLPEKGNFYKSNLHIHTIFSDGGFTLEQVKEEYMKRGYSIVAFTDHDVFVPHQELTDENFLAINSVEVHSHQAGQTNFEYMKSWHLNLYAKTPDITLCPVCDPRWVNAKDMKHVDEAHSQVRFERVHTVESINNLIAKANEANFLVCYNHPIWSMHDFSDYIGLEGLWGIEVYNTGSATEGYLDTADPMLNLCRRGKMVAPVASDDAHSLHHSFGGWTMVKAEKLEYVTVMQAYERGDFYASTGVEIYELYVEDGKLVVECTPDCKICLKTSEY